MVRNDPPNNIGELIDRIDLIRNELLGIQRSMERLDFLKIDELANTNKRDSV